jgi:hypothetical protein
VSAGLQCQQARGQRYARVAGSNALAYLLRRRPRQVLVLVE